MTDAPREVAGALRAVRGLGDAILRRTDPRRMRWDWGEGLLLYAFARIGRSVPEYRAFVAAFFDEKLRVGVPRIDWSDKCPPALAAIEMHRQTGDSAYRNVADLVARYLVHATPTSRGALNHFGTYWYSRVYPQSIWVDSLMMYGVFAAEWGRVTGDASLVDFAADHAVSFARALHDPKTQLWKHARLVAVDRAIPKGDVYWLRGNGWAIAGLASILEWLPRDHPRRAEISDILHRTARAIVPYRRKNHLWSTVVNRETYAEVSGSALVAYGFAKAARVGDLPVEYAKVGEETVAAIAASIELRDGGPSLSGISAATMPYPFLGYALIPRRRDLPYGIAALLLAAMELGELGESAPGVSL